MIYSQANNERPKTLTRATEPPSPCPHLGSIGMFWGFLQYRRWNQRHSRKAEWVGHADWTHAVDPRGVQIHVARHIVHHLHILSHRAYWRHVRESCPFCRRSEVEAWGDCELRIFKAPTQRCGWGISRSKHLECASELFYRCSWFCSLGVYREI